MDIRRIMLYAEWDGSRVQPVFFELLTKAKSLYPEARYAALLLGDGLDQAVNHISSSGVDEILLLDDPRLAIYQGEYQAAAATAAARLWQPDWLLIGATGYGEELAPTLGLRLRTGVSAHCVDYVRKEDGRLAHMVPAFGGKVIGEIFIERTLPQISSSKPGLFTAGPQQAHACTVTPLDPALLDMEPRIKAIQVKRQEVSGVPLEGASLVLCGGFGLCTEASWRKMVRIAELLGGAVGCTRPAVDKGWVDESRMVGTSGRSIKPQLYLGFGISGAAHHLCGVKNAGTIISVNNDPAAEVFAASDYKVVGDAGAVLDALLDQLE